MLLHLIIASLIGHIFMWYDYSLYGSCSVIFAQIFFPENIGMFGSFGAFAIGFLSRPIGGIIFGYIGEKYGRRLTLLWTMSMAAFATIIIGLLPTYNQLGIISPILLITMRFIQGIAFGGELGGAITFLLESFSCNKNRGFIGSTIQCATAIGILLAALCLLILSTILTHDDFMNWGWRISFIFGGIVGLAGIYIRFKLNEPEIYSTNNTNHTIHFKQYFQHIKKVFSIDLKPVLSTVSLELIGGISFYMLNVFAVSLYSISDSNQINSTFILLTINMVCFAFSAMLSGAISDRIGRKKIFIISTLVFLSCSYLALYCFNIKDLTINIITSIMWSINLGFFYGPFSATIAEIFPTNIRHTAVSLLISVTSAIFVGTTPLISTLLIYITGNKYSPAFYLMLVSFIGICILMKLPKKHNQSLK